MKTLNKLLFTSSLSALISMSTYANTLDTLVIYTPDAKKKSSDINAFIKSRVDYANKILKDDKTGVQINVKRKMATSQNFGITAQDIKTHFFESKKLSGWRKLLINHKFDYIMVIADAAKEQYDIDGKTVSGYPCGKAVTTYKTPFISTANRASVFQFLDVKCALTKATIHELGHSLGVAHPKDQSVAPGTKAYAENAYGFGVIDQAVTVMGYDFTYAKKVKTSNIKNLMYFSNPKRQYNGYKMGDTKTAFAQKTVSENAKKLATWATSN